MADEVRSLEEATRDAVAEAMRRALPAELADADPLIRRSDHADFQANAAMSLAKRAGAKPRDLAGSIATALGETSPDLGVELAGPGFLNLSVTDETVWSQVAARLSADRLGVGTPQLGQRTVVEYSSPNIAKEMHVGHLRTTIIGDALARLLEYLGAEVIRQNHLGDWGTQFGMLIQYLDEHPDAKWRAEDLEEGDLGTASALDGLYKLARAEFDADAEFADRARRRVVTLQAGDEATLSVWRELVAESEKSFQAIYDYLGVSLSAENSAGESTYNPYLGEVAAEVESSGVGVISDGALCVFFEGINGPDGSPVPLIVRKSDGGYGYAVTDLATIRYRVRDLKVNRILYVVDARQSLHFRMIFDTARRLGWLTDDVEATHVPFGTVLGSDGRPFKTRAGGTVRLVELLDEAVERARAEIETKPHTLSPEELETVARQAGIGAVKYADLSTSRTKDYTFDTDRMVSFSGNTGVYLQYAHTRVRSILRKLPGGEPTEFPVNTGGALHPSERALALLADEFAATLTEVATTLEPHRLCGYLFSLSKAFTEFYEACPVLTAESDEVRANRVALCQLTAVTLGQGLGLLGIETPERM
ncbi:arginine--tRNA ligase [Pseudonocardia spinosispora]|uniref:arginine--tRNA ligase n=1 Tax=Pseudonocardia spinosispora TaxID=103441 RepID=UPI0003FCE6D7|nr:arginine--tRNA ligase [Pseudonocardia spinosispora]